MWDDPLVGVCVTSVVHIRLSNFVVLAVLVIYDALSDQFEVRDGAGNNSNCLLSQIIEERSEEFIHSNRRDFQHARQVDRSRAVGST